MFWFDIPWWIRFLIGMAVAAVGVYLLVKVDLTLGVIVLGVALALLVIGGRDSSDRRGYKF